MVRIGLLGIKTDEEGVLRTGLLAHLDHLVEGLRGVLDELGVSNQGNVLGGVWNAVDFAVDGEGLDGDILVSRGVTELQRGDDTVLDHAAGAVVGCDGGVRTLSGRNLSDEVVGNLGEVLDGQVDGDAGVVLELLGDLPNDGLTVGVGPHEDGAGGSGRRGLAGGRGRRLLGGVIIGATCGQDADGGNAEASKKH